jgi:MFS family permease
MKQTNTRFWILISIVAISGFSQGMLLPLIAIIFEQSGVSSSLNGLHATSLYIGVLLASPFMEKPLRKYGYKPVILIGAFLVMISMIFFPLWQAFWFWFVLRLMIGIGDHMLHFGTQTWITSSSQKNKLGRNIAIYGLFFGLGFTIGPLMTSLMSIHEFLPFWIAASLSFLGWACMWVVRNEFPEEEYDASIASLGSMKRFLKSWQLAWVAFLPPFAYGFLEASLHGNFPVYALRIGIDVKHVSIILPAFAAGSLITQLPIGMLSDKIGRTRVLRSVILGGFFSFSIAIFFEHSAVALFLCFLISGMLVGSIFSLGISYMTDLLPKSLLPAGNIMCGIAFSIGSILGPLLGGVFIDMFKSASFFYVISGMLLLVYVAMMSFQEKKTQNELQSAAN